MACETPSKFFPTLTTPALRDGAMKGKIALVTGGGTGLGRAIATMFARLGASVAIAARRVDVLEKTAAEIRKETGGVCEAFKMDVKDPILIKTAIDDIEKKLGNVPNVLINNAAGNFIAASERLSPNATKTIIDIVLLGTLGVTNEVAKRAMAKGRGCSVLSISTPYARSGGPFTMPSCAAKAGVEAMTKSLSTEWGKYGFRFNVIAPGPIKTEGAFGRLATVSIDDAVAAAALTVPEGRTGEPEELANLVSFISSDFGSWINGAIIDFDGGQQYHNHPSQIGTQYLHSMTQEQWEEAEQLIRGRTGKTKSKM